MTGRTRKTLGRTDGLARTETGGGRVSCFGLRRSSGASHSVSTLHSRDYRHGHVSFASLLRHSLWRLL